MAEGLSVFISFAALAVSAMTAWLTLFQRGTVRMTQPSLIFLGRDGRSQLHDSMAKVYLRFLLYTTSRRGRIVESMFVRMHRFETSQTFNVWAYGEPNLVRGSGLYVGEAGVIANHHFLLPPDGTTYAFLPGDYTLEVYAKLVGDEGLTKLFSTRLTITPQQADGLAEVDSGLFFDWRPESQSYFAHIDTQPLATTPSLSMLKSLLGVEKLSE